MLIILEALIAMILAGTALCIIPATARQARENQPISRSCSIETSGLGEKLARCSDNTMYLIFEPP